MSPAPDAAMVAVPWAGVLLAAVLSGLAMAGLVAALVLWRRERARARRLVAELEEATTRAEAAAVARDTFLDLAAHELRSPISAILGYQELLEDGAYGTMNPATAEPVERIGRAARHLLHLIDGVVELSRLRSGDARLRPDHVDLGVVLGTLAETFRAQAVDRGIEAQVRMPPALPAIRSDGERLIGALDLLVTSAIKHPAGGVMRLEVEALEDGATVTIDGAEIPVRAESEEPAFRLGIRLAVTRRMADLLGDGLHLETAPDGTIRRLSFSIRSL